MSQVKRRSTAIHIGVSAHKFYSDRDWNELGEFYTNPANLRQENLDSNDLILNTDPDDYNNREQDSSIQLHAEYKGIYGGFHYFENDNLHTPGHAFSGKYRAGIQERLLYLGYRHNFSENVGGFIEVERLFQRDEFATFHIVDSLSNFGVVEPTPFDETDRLELFQFDESQRWDTEVWKYKGQLDTNIGAHNLLSVGFNFWNGDYFYANGVNTLYALESDQLDWPNTKSKKYAFFVQDRLQLFDERLEILAGIRYNKEDYVNDSVTPRVSIVAEPIGGTVFKAIYAEGFRALTFGQFGQAVGSVEPTQMSMLELNYSQSYVSDKLHLMNILSWYTMEQDGVLIPRFTPDRIGIAWENTGEKRTIKGVENFLRAQYDRLSGFFSFYWIAPDKKAVAENGEKYIEDIPEYKVKLGLTAEITERLHLNAFIDHWGETKWELDNYDSVSRTILPGKTLHTQDSFTTINANVRLTNLTLSDALRVKFDVTLAVDNVTNKKYVHHLRPWIAMGFMQPPRRLWVKTDVRF